MDDAQIAAKIKTEGTQTRTALQAATVHGIQTPDDPIQTALNAQSALAVSTQITSPGSQLHEDLIGLTSAYMSQQLGVVTPSQLTLAGLQAAADEAKAKGERLWAAGDLFTTETLHLNCDLDMAGLTINYGGAGDAVVLGSMSEVSWRIAGSAPKAIYTGDRATNHDTVGIRAVNLNTARIYIPYIRSFGKGLLVWAESQGNAYNEFSIGHLDTNRVNMELDRNAGGWVNENVFFNGRYGHSTWYGTTRVPGTAHINMVYREGHHPINNNRWIKPSVEGNVAEFHAIFSGSYNIIDQARWESTEGARVRWAMTARYNTIHMGYGAQWVEEIFDDTSVIATTNQIYAPNQLRLVDYNRPVLVAENSNGGAVIAIQFPGSRAAGLSTYNGAHGASAAAVTYAHNFMLGRAAPGERERMLLNWVTGRTSFGPGGTTGPPAQFGWDSNNGGLSITGANLHMTAANSIGHPTNIGWRPGYIRARSGITPGVFTTAGRIDPVVAGKGTMIYDDDLDMPLWSDGTIWRDAMRNPV
ncbi:hypothetical protein GCM10009670_26050 [Citricoccus alkalitolerans]